MKKKKLADLPKETRQQLLRLFFILEEIDRLKEEYPKCNRDENVQACIDMLKSRAEEIRAEFLADRKK